MSLPKPDMHVRVSEPAMAVLEVLAQAQGKPAATLAGELIEESVLGKGHALRVAAAKLARLGLCGIAGETRE